MVASWMGRYRGIVAALVRHGNIAARSQFARNEVYPGISLTHQEWQVLEYIIEHASDDANMIQISEHLAIPQSSFSKISNLLHAYQLIEKFRVYGNRKNIVLKATQRGVEVYQTYSQTIQRFAFDRFFENLSELSDRDLAIVTHAIEELDNVVTHTPERDMQKELIPNGIDRDPAHQLL